MGDNRPGWLGIRHGQAILPAGPSRKAAAAPVGESPPAAPETAGTPEEMARAVVERIEAGPFKSTECQKIIKERWPKHSLASAGGGAFGIEFKNNIWPVLEGWGVRISNPGKNPVKYEMTEEAKTKLSLDTAGL